MNSLIVAILSQVPASAHAAEQRSVGRTAVIDTNAMQRGSACPVHRGYVRRGAVAQSGVGLIEVLVAVLVLSVAFLGIAALQAMSMSTNNGAMARSMATIASYSIIDAMRADISNAETGAYNTATPIAANACPTTAGTLAQSQLVQWCGQLAQNLGAVATTTGSISCTATADGSSADCTVTITFDDSRSGNGSVNGSTNQIVTTRALL
ncbi:type IV pilus modification protein PilV [Rhodanobacter umsongensis]